MGMLLKRKIFLSIVIIFVSSTFILVGMELQNPYIPPRKGDFNLIFKYGVGAKNVLNTFDNTYTKDMVMSPPITIRLYLSDEEIEQIRQKMFEIGFFSYPESFPLSTGGGVTPSSDYYIKVQNGSAIKEVSWNSNSHLDGNVEDNLRQLVRCITDVVEQRPEYKALPPPNGGYC
jgi:hypothetical protein